MASITRLLPLQLRSHLIIVRPQLTSSTENQTMKTLKIPFLVIIVVIVVIVGWAQPQGCAADIPAGTTILIRTTKNINSDEPPGTGIRWSRCQRYRCRGQSRDSGRHTGRWNGEIAPLHSWQHQRPLTLRLIGLTSHGRTIAIETENLQCESNSPLTIGPNRRVQITGDAFIYNAGTLIPFRFKQPVTI
jgi:hypothetical protein